MYFCTVGARVDLTQSYQKTSLLKLELSEVKTEHIFEFYNNSIKVNFIFLIPTIRRTYMFVLFNYKMCITSNQSNNISHTVNIVFLHIFCTFRINN